MKSRTIRLLFWNVESLFDPANGCSRGPKTAAALSAKLDGICRVLNRSFDGGADIIGLAEVQTSALAAQIGQRLKDKYWVTFADAGDISQPGLTILTRAKALLPPVTIDTCMPYAFGRPRATAVEYRVHGEKLTFILAHWKSRIPSTAFPDDRDREETAAWTADLLNHRPRQATILVGDFNAEPFESPFSFGDFRSVRFHEQAMHRGAMRSTLYNSAWRFLGWQLPTSKSTRAPRSTVGSRPPAIFDQLLVSGELLRSSGLRLIEDTVSIDTRIPSAQVWGGPSPIHSRDGGLSDHFPLRAIFRL